MNRETTSGISSKFPHDSFFLENSARKDHSVASGANPTPDPEVRGQQSEIPPAQRRRLGVMSLVGLLGALLIANVCAALFVSLERVVYCWDFSGYWKLSKYWVLVEKGPFIDAVKTLLHSVATDDYNLLPSVAIGTWMAVAGESRMAYILGIVNIYVASVLVMLMVLNRWFWGEREARQGPWIEIVPAALLLLVPPFWVPVLRGYLDVGGVAIAFAVLWLYFTSTRRAALHPVFFGIGLLLGGLYLFRRWYAFWVVSFLAVAALERTAMFCRDCLEHRLNLRRAVRILAPILVMGGTMGLVLVTLALPLLRRVMATNYTDIFSSYNKQSTIYQHFVTEAGYFGWAPLSYALAGVVGLLGFRETRRMSLFMFLQAGLIFCHFTSVQGFGSHHRYLLLPGFLLVVSVFALKVACLPSRGWLRIAWLGSVLALGLGTSVPVFFRPARLHAKTLGRLMPVNSCYPLVRNDVPELIRMFSVLDRYFEQSDGRVYVLAASHTFSSDTLLNAAISLPVPFNSTDRVITQCPHVDKRDGFPRELLNAQFVLVATPVQYHLRPADQQVIGVPAESFLNQTDIGRAFEKLPESFVLENGARVLLFRRTRPIEPAEVAQLSERFRASYPDRPYIYRP